MAPIQQSTRVAWDSPTGGPISTASDEGSQIDVPARLGLSKIEHLSVLTSPQSQEQSSIALQDPSSRQTILSPITILDRNVLLASLDKANLPIKNRQIDAFYEALHRQHYPPLDQFLAEYYRRESESPTDSTSHDTDHSPKSRSGHHHLSRRLLEFIQNPDNHFVTTTSTVSSTTTSRSGNATKLAIRLDDGHIIETVVMRYPEVDGVFRASVSLSSQVGCTVDCTLSSEPTVSFSRNLTAGEILEQVVHALHVLRQQNSLSSADMNAHSHLVQNVTFMGMGEPLENYNNVVEACRCLSNRNLWSLCRGRITISTLGITPRMYDLTRDLPKVIVALGLHASIQTQREAIVPSARHYPVQELMGALDNHMKGAKRRNVMIEYIMVEGDTSSLESAHELGRLCENRNFVVNLIPYTRNDHVRHLAHMKDFQSIVSSYGPLCNIRLTMSAEVKAAPSHVPESIEIKPVRRSDKDFWKELEMARKRASKNKSLKRVSKNKTKDENPNKRSKLSSSSEVYVIPEEPSIKILAPVESSKKTSSRDQPDQNIPQWISVNDQVDASPLDGTIQPRELVNDKIHTDTTLSVSDCSSYDDDMMGDETSRDVDYRHRADDVRHRNFLRLVVISAFVISNMMLVQRRR